MENIDIKTIAYFVIAILWFLFSSFKKAQKESKKKTAPPPPLSEEEIKEILKPKEETIPFESRKSLKKEKVIFKEDRKRVVQYPTTTTITNPVEGENDFFMENEEETVEILTDLDPRKMIIFSEILKRKEF